MCCRVDRGDSQEKGAGLLRTNGDLGRYKVC